MFLFTAHPMTCHMPNINKIRRTVQALVRRTYKHKHIYRERQTDRRITKHIHRKSVNLLRLILHDNSPLLERTVYEKKEKGLTDTTDIVRGIRGVAFVSSDAK
jgi:hypothetical protein